MAPPDPPAGNGPNRRGRSTVATGSRPEVVRGGIYPRVWANAFTSVALASTLLGWLFWQPGVVTFVLCASLAAAVTLQAAFERDTFSAHGAVAGGWPRSSRGWLQCVTGRGIVSSLWCTGLICLGVFDPGVAAAAVFTSVLTAPRTLHLVRAAVGGERDAVRTRRRRGTSGNRARGHASSSPVGHEDQVSGVSAEAAFAEVLRCYDNAELSRAWNRSFARLYDVSSPSDLDRVASLRRLYLDEWERRDPAGLLRWLQTNPRASGDPTAHLLDPP